MQLHDETISVICVSTDSKVVFTGDSTGFVKFWHISSFCDLEVTNSSSPEHCIPDCHDLGINQAEFSPKVEITSKTMKNCVKLIILFNYFFFFMTCRSRKNISNCYGWKRQLTETVEGLVPKNKRSSSQLYFQSVVQYCWAWISCDGC